MLSLDHSLKKQYIVFEIQMPKDKGLKLPKIATLILSLEYLKKNYFLR